MSDFNNCAKRIPPPSHAMIDTHFANTDPNHQQGLHSGATDRRIEGYEIGPFACYCQDQIEYAGELADVAQDLR